MNAVVNASAQAEPGLVLEESEPAPSRTDVRHLRMVADMLREEHIAGASAEVMRAIQEIESARPVLERGDAARELMRLGLVAIERAELQLAEKLKVWSSIDATKLTREQRMERRDWEAELRRDVAYGHKRLLAAVRAFVADGTSQAPSVKAEHEREVCRLERARQPTSPREWLNV
jgi:hypothetical protein